MCSEPQAFQPSLLRLVDAVAAEAASRNGTLDELTLRADYLSLRGVAGRFGASPQRCKEHGGRGGGWETGRQGDKETGR